MMHLTEKHEDWHHDISQAEHQILVEEAWAPMRDGVKLATDIYRPASPGKFPALISLSIYGKLSQKLPTNPVFQPSDYVWGTGGHECGEQNFFVPRGYAQVIPDVRGVGKSDGDFSMDLSRDGHDLVEWVAQQPWCNGKVGMVGMSQFGMSQFQVAATKPPSLAAICPFEARSDAYRHHFYHGGIFNYYFANSYGRLLPLKSARQALSLREFSKEELAERKEALLKDPNILCLPYLAMATETPQLNPLIFDLLMHPFDGEFYKRQSSKPLFDQIEVPALLGSRWNGGVLHLAGAFEAFEGLAAKNKQLIIVPSDNYGGMDRPFHEIQDVMLRFYDHWLKDNDTGMMDEPKMLFFIQGENKWRHEEAFPPKGVEWTKLYLNGERLTWETPPSDIKPRTFTSAPWANPTEGFARADTRAQADPVPKLVYETQTLRQAVEICGPLALYWHAAIESAPIVANDPTTGTATPMEPVTNDTSWFLKLYDVDPVGRRRCLAEGWLKASHHELDPEKSTPHTPYHPHTRALPIEPGQIILYAADLRMTSNVFLAGHRIRLEIAGQDQVQAIWYHQPHMAQVTHEVTSSASQPSYLLLPIMPKDHIGAGEPSAIPAGQFRYPKHLPMP